MSEETKKDKLNEKQDNKQEDNQTMNMLEHSSEATEYVPQKELKSLKDVIDRMHIEADFASKAFAGNTKDAKESLKSTTSELNKVFRNLDTPLKTFNTSNQKLELTTKTLAILPDKIENILQGLTPQIGQEIEKIHDQRMIEIESTLKNLKKGLDEETQSQLQILKDLAEQLQKQLSEDVLRRIKMLELATNKIVEQMNSTHLQQLEKQEKSFTQFTEHAKKEISAFTANHGSKFLRNTAICLILATITGAVSGWYINGYFPRFVSFSKTGDVTIHHSHVKLLDYNSVKKQDLNTTE